MLLLLLMLMLMMMMMLWWRVRETCQVKRVTGSGTGTSTSVGIEEEHVGRWVLCRVREGYVVWVHEVKCLQPFGGGLDF